MINIGQVLSDWIGKKTNEEIIDINIDFRIEQTTNSLFEEPLYSDQSDVWWRVNAENPSEDDEGIPILLYDGIGVVKFCAPIRDEFEFQDFVKNFTSQSDVKISYMTKIALPTYMYLIEPYGEEKKQLMWIPENCIGSLEYDCQEIEEKSINSRFFDDAKCMRLFSTEDLVSWNSDICFETSLIFPDDSEEMVVINGGEGFIDDYVWYETPASLRFVHESINQYWEDGCYVYDLIPNGYIGWVYLLRGEEYYDVNTLLTYYVWIPEKYISIDRVSYDGKPIRSKSSILETEELQISVFCNLQQMLTDLSIPLSPCDAYLFSPGAWKRFQEVSNKPNYRQWNFQNETEYSAWE